MSNEFKINAKGGLRIPLLTNAEESAIPLTAVSNGLIWYNKDANSFKQVVNAAMQDLGGTPSAADIAITDAGGNYTATDVEAALAEVMDALQALNSLSGVAISAVDLGTFTGGTIPDASTIKGALQALEAEVELKAASSVVTEIDANVDDLITLSGVAENSAHLGTFTGGTIPDSSTSKGALQALETAVELRALDSAVVKKAGSTMDSNADLTFQGGGEVLGLPATPSGATAAASKAYVDAVAEGMRPKEAVRAATTVAGTLATSFENADVIDGVTLATGDRILLKDQAAAAENGIYIVAASGAPTRATDFNSVSPIDEINGASVAVQEGTANAGKIFVQAGAVVTIDTDAINFVFFNSVSGLTGGDGITVSGSNISVDHDGQGLIFSSTQLALELDGATLSKSATGLKVADAGVGVSQLAAAVAGAGLAGGAGSALSVNVDGSTLEIPVDTLQVKDAGITNAKIATGIDAVKLADGTVTNAEFQYLGGVTSDIQTQLNAKLDTVSEDTAPALGGNLTLGANVVIHDGDGLKLGSSASDFFETEYLHSITLTASQTSAVASALTFAHASFEGVEISYKIKEATSNAVRQGTLHVATNGSAKSITDSFSETGDVGVEWDLNVNGANMEIRYTTTANAKTMRAVVKRIKA